MARATDTPSGSAGQTLLSWKGPVSHSAKAGLLREAEARLAAFPCKARKRVCNVLLEMLDNMARHAPPVLPHQHTFSLMKTPKGWRLTSSNPVARGAALQVRRQLQGLTDARERYRERLSRELPAGSTPGLGLLYMTRKGSRPPAVTTARLTKSHHLLELRVDIANNP